MLHHTPLTQVRQSAPALHRPATLSTRHVRHHLAVTAAILCAAGHVASALAQSKPAEIRLDWATYNPVSIVLKNEGLLEKEFAPDAIAIRWVQSAGSNKALEFLNAGSLDFGSTAGAAALVGRINGNPIKAVYAYSRPEWTALVSPKGSQIKAVADLKGKRIAVTRGTDPHIFLVRALQMIGLTERDVRVVPLQHADGRLALARGDVDAWAGLDPLMAAAEIEDGAQLFYRDAAANTWGVLNVREDFARQHPQLVRRVLQTYEVARTRSIADISRLRNDLASATKLPPSVLAKQIDERTDLSRPKIGAEQHAAILAAGLALQKAGVVKAEVDIAGVVKDLLDPSFH